MTTAEAEKLNLMQHLMKVGDRNVAIYNPHDKPVEELPVIYGFNNGGSPEWYSGVLIDEDGEVLGDHLCSHEGYMPHDLGILEGTRPDRHEHFKAHYPDGYRMEFVPENDVRAQTRSGFESAVANNYARKEDKE